MTKISRFILFPISLIHCTSLLCGELELKKSIDKENQQIQALKNELSHSRQVKESLISNLELEAADQQSDLSRLHAQLACIDPDCLVIKDPEACPCALFQYYPDLSESWGYLSGEWLLWRTLEDNLDYAVQGQPYNADLETGAIGHYKTAKFGWDSGFRFTFGYHFCPNQWEIKASYTLLNNSGHNESAGPEIPEGEILVPTFNQNYSGSSSLAKASSQIDLLYQTFDLLAEKRFVVSDSVLFSLYSGLAAASIDQDWTLNYKSTTIYDKLTISECFRGLGVKAGLATLWHFGSGFGADATLAFSGLVGHYTNLLNDLQLQLGPDTSDVIQNTQVKQNRFAYATQFRIGPSWSRRYETWGVKISCDYEMNSWFNIHEIYRTILSSGVDARELRLTSGTMALQGLTANLSFNF